MQLMKTFINNKKSFKLRNDTGTRLTIQCEYESEVLKEVSSSPESRGEALKHAVLKDIDTLCGMFNQNVII